MFWKILIAVLFFGFMIMSHEFGHFITARMFKIGVNEFSIGMGPKLFSKTSKKSGTAYSVRAFPIGGFVSLVGEDEVLDRDDALTSKAWWKRLIVLGAGSFTNILFAIIAMFALLSLSPYYPTTYIADREGYSVISDSVLSDYGVIDGDRIISIDGEKMNVWQDISYKITSDGTQPLDIVIERQGEQILLEGVTFKTQTVEGILCGVVDFSPLYIKRTVPYLIKEAIYESFATVKIIYSSLSDLVSGKYGIDAFSGPVGTVEVIAESASQGIRPLLYLFSFITMNVGLVNLLPLPALDGGRIIFVLLEALRGRPVKHEAYVHAIGMILLLLFMAVIMISDIRKLF